MAGSTEKSSVPRAIARWRMAGWSTGDIMPTSVIQTSAPTVRAIALTPARPLAIVTAMDRVISWGQGVTPWAWTPWSPANTATSAGSGDGGGT